MAESLYDVIIIGSGPAGLTAGIYTSRAALKTLLFAGSPWGGQLMLTTEVENYPGFPEGILGPELMMHMRKQAERFGVEIVDKDVSAINVEQRPFSVSIVDDTIIETGLKPVSTEERPTVSFKANSIIIATGADTKWLGVPGENKFIGKGVSSCAPCDAFFYKGKRVIVVGGGDSAMEEALVLTKFAETVTIVHRRDSFKASKIMQERVMKHPKINVLWNTEVVEVMGDQKVTTVRLKTKKLEVRSSKIDNEVGPIDGLKNGEKNQISKNEQIQIQDQSSNFKFQTSTIPIDGIFVAVGHIPNTEIFKGKIALDEKGYVKKVQSSKFKVQNEKGEVIGNRFPSMTSVEGVFVAGDVHDYHYKQAVTAAGYGCEAALEVERWLENETGNKE